MKGQAQLEYALLVGAAIAVMIAIIYARRTEFRRLPEGISSAGSIDDFKDEMTKTDW